MNKPIGELLEKTRSSDESKKPAEERRALTDVIKRVQMQSSIVRLWGRSSGRKR